VAVGVLVGVDVDVGLGVNVEVGVNVRVGVYVKVGVGVAVANRFPRFDTPHERLARAIKLIKVIDLNKFFFFTVVFSSF
jgi:hypothetical protein